MVGKKCIVISMVFMLFLVPMVGAQAQEGQPGDEPLFEDPFGEEEYEEGPTIADPIEPWNRAMYHFNDKLYFWVLKPVAKGYAKVVPEWGRLRVRNVFNNAAAPIRVANSLLQLKLESAGLELFRFVANTTAGLGGLFDLSAGNPEFRESDEDLGQTFGVYGVGNGFYIVWPFLGPSSLRDTVGRVGDGYLYPVNYLSETALIIGIKAYETINETSLRIGDYEDLKDSALDPYIAIKDAYVQHRTSKVDK